MKTRNSKKIRTEITDAQFEEAMGRYAEAMRREAEINSGIKEEVDEVVFKYKDELAVVKQGINAAFDTVQCYCINNKETLFAHRRSIGTIHGIAGFRLGMPRLKTKKGADWNTVMVQLKEKFPDYIRTSEEPARDRLLADRHKDKVAHILREIGVEAVQDELFYIELRNAA